MISWRGQPLKLRTAFRCPRKGYHSCCSLQDQGMPAGEEVAAEDDGENQDVQLLAAYYG